MTKPYKRWTLMNAKTGKLLKTRSYSARSTARFFKKDGDYQIFDTWTGRIVR